MNHPFDERRNLEKSPQSENSPGIIDNSELLLRALFTPDHIDENGKIKEQAIPSQDLSERGFSIQRESYTNDKLNQIIIDGWLNNKTERDFICFGKILCSHAREIKDSNNKQAFVIFDDTLENNPAHAMILTAEKYGKGTIKKLRHQLLLRLNHD